MHLLTSYRRTLCTTSTPSVALDKLRNFIIIAHIDSGKQESRSARAVEGALLLVDATRGVQAQTLSSVDLSLTAGLDLNPVINKIDLPTADFDGTRHQMSHLIGLDGDTATLTSAKNGVGIESCLDAIVERLPPPSAGNVGGSLQMLVFDSYFDSHRGAVLLVRVVHGAVAVGDAIVRVARGLKSVEGEGSYTVDGIGVLTPDENATGVLAAGEIGYVTAAIRRVGDIPVGSTVTHVYSRENVVLVGEAAGTSGHTAIFESAKSPQLGRYSH